MGPVHTTRAFGRISEILTRTVAKWLDPGRLHHSDMSQGCLWQLLLYDIALLTDCLKFGQNCMSHEPAL